MTSLLISLALYGLGSMVAFFKAEWWAHMIEMSSRVRVPDMPFQAKLQIFFLWPLHLFHRADYLRPYRQPKSRKEAA